MPVLQGWAADHVTKGAPGVVQTYRQSAAASETSAARLGRLIDNVGRTRVDLVSRFEDAAIELRDRRSLAFHRGAHGDRLHHCLPVSNSAYAGCIVLERSASVLR